MKKFITIIFLSFLWCGTSNAKNEQVCDWIVNEVYADLLKEESNDHLFVVVGKDGRCEYGRGTDKYKGLSECEKHKKINLIDGICRLFAIGEKKIAGNFSETKFKTGEKIKKKTGCIEGNCTNGKGTFILSNGAKYVGEWKDGKIHGEGTMEWSDGGWYEGQWKNGKRHGKGTMRFLNDTKYVGLWENDKRHGKGVSTHSFNELQIWENDIAVTLIRWWPLKTNNKIGYLFKNNLYHDCDIIKKKDPTTFLNLSFLGVENIKWFDYRLSTENSMKYEIYFDAFIFKARFEKGKDVTIRVNSEFKTKEKAEKIAKKYAKTIGQLPNFLRVPHLLTSTIHKGNGGWGGGNSDILIHTGTSPSRRGVSKCLEEVMIHEGAHVSIDFFYTLKGKKGNRWKDAANKDNKYVTPYARKNPFREDIAETINWWIAVRCKKDRISKSTYKKIVQNIPNRLEFFDNQDFDTYPLVCK